MIIDKIICRIEEIDISSYSVDLVLFDHFDLIRPHQKVTTQKGNKLAISLPHGEQLYKGAVLVMDDKQVIAVDLLEEDVFEIRPQGIMQWARVSFNIGNMHKAAYLSEDDICIPYDPIMEKMLNALHVDYSRKKRKLDGIRANVAAHHHHNQSHNHDGKEHSHE